MRLPHTCKNVFTHACSMVQLLEIVHVCNSIRQLLEIVCTCVLQDSPAARVIGSSYVTARKEEGRELSWEEEEEEEEVIYPTLSVPSDVDPWYLPILCTIVCNCIMCSLLLY